jgi:DNA mismatch repair protein MSH5
MEVMFTTKSSEIIKDSATSTKGESITYLYRSVTWAPIFNGVIVDAVCGRAVDGLSLESYAARCAELFGVPAHVVQRAQYVTYVPL